MKNSKLFRIIQTFSLIERKEVVKFLASPLFNQRQDVQQLFVYLSEPTFDPLLSNIKSIIYKKIHPTLTYESVKIDLLMSYLFRLLNQYLSWKEFSTNDDLQQLYTAKAYQNRGLKMDFQRAIDRLKKSIQKKGLKNAAYYQLIYQIEWETFQAEDRTNPNKAMEVWEILEAFDLAYLTTKLQHLCLLQAHKMVYPSTQEAGFLKELLVYIKLKNLQTIPAINLYYHCYLMLSQPEVAGHFQKFKQLLFELDHYFSALEKRILLLMGINYCVKQTNDGQSTFLYELLDLYQGGLKNQYLLEKGLLSRFTFHNIVGTGLSTNHADWVADFIATYKNNLAQKDRESTYSFSLARLAYHKKDYDAVLALLQKSNYRDVLLNLAAKTLLLKIYVEQDQDDALFAHLEAMQRYIRRKRVIGYHKKNYLNIIKLTKKMRSINPFDKKEIIGFEQVIKETETLTERKWFLQQIALL